MENPLSPRGELNVFFFSYEVLIATVSLSSLLCNIFVVYFSGFTPLEQSLLVVPKLRSDFVADVTIGLR